MKTRFHQNTITTIGALCLVVGGCFTAAVTKASAAAKTPQEGHIFPGGLPDTNKFRRMNLREHLLRPTPQDYKDGVENSRRLKRHSAMLEQRDLIAAKPPEFVTNFDGQIIAPIVTDFDREKFNNFDFRVTRDKPLEFLPPKVGPGVDPGWPKATKGFWDGTDFPEQMWEIVACSVVDPEGFLNDPIRCYFSEDDDTTIADFFLTAIEDGSMAEFVNDIGVTVATEIILTLSPIQIFDTLFESVCSILGTVDDIIGAVEDLAGFFEDGFSAAGGFFSDVGDFFSGGFGIFRRDLSEDGAVDTCVEAHQSPCLGVDDAEACAACLENPDQECEGCFSCWRPMAKAIPEMEGICLKTESLRDLNNADVVPITLLLTLHNTLLANFMKKVSTSELEGVDKSDIMEEIERSTSTIMDVVIEQCPGSEDASGSQTRRLGEESGFSTKDLKRDGTLSQQQLETIRKSAESLGLSEDNVDGILDMMIDQVGAMKHDRFINEDLKKNMKHLFDDSGATSAMEHEMQRTFTADQTANNLASELLRSLRDPSTGKLNKAGVRRTRELLEELKHDKNYLKEVTQGFDLGQRNLGPIEDACNSVRDFIVNAIKDAVRAGIKFAVENGAAGGVFGGDSPVSKAADFFGAKGLTDGIQNGMFTLIFPFLEHLDPINLSALVYGPTVLIVNLFQRIAAFVLFGCDFGDLECHDKLPSRNKILTITESAPDNDGNTEYYMTSGCDSNFEGELVFYDPILSILQALLQAAADSIPELFNIPINLLRMLVDTTKGLFDRMDNACDYLDAFVFNSMIEASFHNTRYLLNEVACRPVSQLQWGHGCDGVDNNCDIDGARDECEEDVIPPRIDTTAALSTCSGDKVFQSLEEASACVVSSTAVVDDCKPVETAFSVEATAESCSAGVTVTATALGCGARKDLDISSATIPVQVDSTPPDVECSFDTEFIDPTKNGIFVDSGFSFSASDDCDDNLDVKIEVLSSEVVLTGEEMVLFSSPEVGEEGSELKLYLEADICSDRESGSDDESKGICRIDSNRNARTYATRVVATDAAGNKGTAECAIVVFEPRPIGKSGKSGSGDSELTIAPPEPELDILFSLKTFQFSQTSSALDF